MTVKSHAAAAQEGINRKIKVAVDLGTTFSGLAWAQTARHEIQSAIIQWPDTEGSLEGQTSDKVPTELIYEGRKIKWGFEIPEDVPRHVWFKLGLDPKQADQVSHLSIEYPDPKSLPPSYDHDPTKLATDYLKCLYQHTHNILKLKLGQGVVDTTPIEFIITVPAIWDDAAKARTAACAKAAGMGENVGIITEPEAAIVYTLDAMDPHDLKVGDQFVLCDAGGGTVDVISYVILELSPRLKVKEAVRGDGNACGSTFLNRIFGEYLEAEFGDDEEWDDDTKEVAMRAFEENAKRKFSGEETNIVIPVPGLLDDPSRGVKRGRLTIPARKIKTLFQPVIAMITSLIKTQIRQTGKAQAVLLVGGFGQSAYLRKCIEKVVGKEIAVMQPPNGWTAVVRGALIRALNDEVPASSRISIASRIARKAYGVRASRRYDAVEDAGQPKFWDAFHGFFSVSAMTWLVNKGDAIDETSPVSHSFTLRNLVADGGFYWHSSKILSYASSLTDDAPKYPCSEIKTLVTLSAVLSSIPTSLLPVRLGKDGNEYYVMHFEIKTAFFSAHTEYSLWYNEVCYGKVQAEYA